MSMFIEAAITAAQTPVAAGGEGIFDFITLKSAEAVVAARAVIIAAAVGFFLWRVVASRMAMAAMIVAGLCAGLMIWIGWNVTDIDDRFDSEINGSAQHTQTRHVHQR
jgi:hypothetical protein